MKPQREDLAAAYNEGWNDCMLMVAEQQAARLSKRAQRTSREAVARNADGIRGTQKAVYIAIRNNPLGLTDFDLESSLGRTHQSVSAARNALMNAGLVTDSGKTRPNARGNRCIVWVVSSPSSKDENDPIVDPVPVPTPTAPSFTLGGFARDIMDGNTALVDDSDKYDTNDCPHGNRSACYDCQPWDDEGDH